MTRWRINYVAFDEQPIARNHHFWYKITMMSSVSITLTLPRTVPISLSDCPQARLIGIGIHGNKPVENYRMLKFWCVHLYTYHAQVMVNGYWYEISPGSASVFPPDAEMQYHFKGRCEHAFAHFFLPASSRRSLETLPVMQQLEDRFDRLNVALREAVGWFPSQRRRAEVRVWDVLWDLTASASQSAENGGAGSAVETLCREIEMRLAGEIRVGPLLDELSLGVSHNHLLRLFRRQTGTSILDYVRGRRVERAEHLLRHSTLPIKQIAHQVGIGDLHLFNKTIRRILGASPREVRGRGSGLMNDRASDRRKA